MKELINGQNISFDTHQAGDGQEINIKGLHLHKEFRDKSKRGSAKFSFFCDAEPANQGMNKDDFDKVVREVKKALRRDEDLTKSLAEEIVKQLKRFSNGTATLEKAREAAKNFAGYFNLDKEFLRVTEEYSEEHLSAFVSVHFNQFTQTYHKIRQSKEEIAIEHSVYPLHPRKRKNRK